MKENDAWSVSDFYSAVILRASGIPLAGLTHTHDKFFIFHFSASPAICEEIIKKHWDRNLKLETRLFIETINELKTRIHEQSRKDKSYYQ